MSNNNESPSIIQEIIEWYNRVNVRQKKRIATYLGISFLFIIAGMIVFGTEDHQRPIRVRKQKIEYSLFNGNNPKDVSVEALSGRLKGLEKDLSELRVYYQNQDKRFADATSRFEQEANEFSKTVDLLNDKTESMFSKLKGMEMNGADNVQLPSVRKRENSFGRSGRDNKSTAVPGLDDDVVLDDAAPTSKIRQIGEPVSHKDKSDKGEQKSSSDANFSARKRITRLVNVKGGKDDVHGNATSAYLPATSLLTGTLVSGLDAPGSNQAREDPLPALLKLSDNAILPNRFRMDVKECHLIVSGFGDIASSRAYLRGEVFVCVRKDGSVIETPVDAYAIGRDGKNGVRGRIVHKSGNLIGNALLSGAIAGIANAFAPQRVQSFNTVQVPGQQQIYQYPSPEFIAGQALSGGVKGAAERIADYYLEMAKNIFPVIEVDAGEAIDLVLIRGIDLSPKTAASVGHGNTERRSSGRPQYQAYNSGMPWDRAYGGAGRASDRTYGGVGSSYQVPGTGYSQNYYR